MEHASDCVNMVPLRYRGSRKFAAVHKDIMLGTESTVKETSYRSSYRAPPDTQKTLKDDSKDGLAMHYKNCSTYQSDFIERPLPVTRLRPALVQAKKPVPFNATTTYRRDFNPCIGADIATPDAAGNCQPPR
ncbi:hypothetical protein X943_003162 [Babesia divergens]|uniref:Uncharacterized protein n=1 Tax=Babesia divergens TaxID=32595 RepID=A0AAD9GHT0_BABDI|nr:hypothetical protein X943_003162 [Babesia divergens]